MSMEISNEQLMPLREIMVSNGKKGGSSFFVSKRDSENQNPNIDASSEKRHEIRVNQIFNNTGGFS